VYRAGSVSKLFTSIALMQLVEAGQVDLDAPLTTYIPRFKVGPPPPWFDAPDWTVETLTIRRLMTHRSGLFGDVFGRMMDETSPATAGVHIDYAASTFVAAPPDEVRAYSNVAYGLLGVVVEVVSEELYTDYITNHILVPCEMKRSAFFIPDRMRGMYAQPHNKGKVQPTYNIGIESAGALFTTVPDLARFAQMLLNGGKCGDNVIVGEETLLEMWTPQDADVRTRLDERMGLTFFIDQPKVRGADQNVGHGGATLYHRASLLVLPKEKLAAVALANSPESKTGKFTRVLLEHALESKTGIRLDKETAIKDGTLTSEQKQAFVGEWTTELGYVHVVEDEGDLKLFGLGQELKLVPTDRGGARLAANFLWFFSVMPDDLKTWQVQVEEQNGRTVLVRQDTQGKRSRLGDKIAELPEPGPAWSARAGTYEVELGETEARLFDKFVLEKKNVNDTERLLLWVYSTQGSQKIPYVLYVANDTDAFLYGRGRNLGQLVRALPDGTLLFHNMKLTLKAP